MPIGDYCRENPVTVKKGETARQAAAIMKRENTGSLVVTEKDHPVGLVTDRDLALRLLAERRDPTRPGSKT